MVLYENDAVMCADFKNSALMIDNLCTMAGTNCLLSTPGGHGNTQTVTSMDMHLIGQQLQGLFPCCP